MRPISIDDLDDFVALHADPEVTRFITRFDRAQAEERLLQNDAEWRERGHGMLAILDRGAGGFLGRAAIKYWPQFDETELGWALRREAWGHGYATEAAGACADWAFSELPVPYLTAMVSPENARSIRVAERLGMSPLREDVLLGEPVVVHALQRRCRPRPPTPLTPGRVADFPRHGEEIRHSLQRPQGSDALTTPGCGRSIRTWVGSVSRAATAVGRTVLMP